MLPGARGDAEVPGPDQEGAVPQGRASHGEEKPGLPLCRKLCYAIGGIPYQMTANALGFFLQIFLLDVVQLEPFHASLILFLGRAWDAVTDPAVGFLVSKSPRRKYGKLIPWIACSMPFGVLCYCMMWSTLADGAPVSLKFLWYLFTYNFFQICMTEWGWRCSARCSAQESRGRWWALTTATRRMAAPSGTGPCPTAAPPASPARWRSRAYVSASLVLGSIYCLSCLILVFGVREQPGPLSPLGKAGLPFTSCLRTIVGHKPYTHLLCGFLFASLAFQVMQGIFAFFCTHAAGLAGKFQHLVLIMLVTASLSIPFWQWFLGRFGKKTAVTLGLALIIPALVAITLVSHNFPAFVLLMVVAGCSSAVLYLLPWSMLPDAVDDFMLRNPNCLNLEALFYSFYVFFNKFAGGLAVGISTLGLHFAGYRARDCTYNPSVTLALKLLMTPVPIILLLIAITIFCLHPINEERRKQMRMELEAMGRQARRGSSDHHQG
ncbi:sodium-dependent lysophosphatidylcholine symporter 1-like isoform X3 [Cygnus olor]|uniref:sodium-dependent lysophosphatidylcholine symporter 1-like isoform X3 n=1 Tax=Cygnus olor TaxID=8869 RepID=UPI001ADE5F69|nr:sodium-dependent lysophosphatidylcholine symporter 1-like isoform X3 [Cygnus olor]